VDGAKAYILPALAALLLAGWWIFAPDPDPDPHRGAPIPADALDTAIDAEIGTAVAACRAAHPDAPVTRVMVVVGGSAGGPAMVEQLLFEPSELPGALRTCLLEPVGAQLSVPAPAEPRRRDLHRHG
jgi:hypothetical protein